MTEAPANTPSNAPGDSAAADTLTIRFFARLREELGVEAMTVTAESGLTAAKLLQTLAAKGGHWAQLDGAQPVMIAVNQAMAKPEVALRPGDEVAFFPPVTGG